MAVTIESKVHNLKNAGRCEAALKISQLCTRSFRFEDKRKYKIDDKIRDKPYTCSKRSKKHYVLYTAV